MRIWPFRASRAEEDAERLLEAVMAASRRPAWFGAGRTPDTMEGRFEVMAVNAGLALVRLRAAPDAEPLAQSFTDKLFRHFDAGLREAGVGDTTVPKKMRGLAGSFYGRLQAYSAALKAEDGDLAGALARNLGAPEAFAERLATHLRETARRQAEAPVSALMDGAGWPEFTG
jgi:cytochrome b pre-mRNA-processing protein 3